MKLVLKFSVCLVMLCMNVGATILIAGPHYIRPNRDYTIAIRCIGSETNYDCLLNVRIDDEDEFANRSILLNLRETVKIMADTNEMVTFKIPKNLTYGAYQIIVEGKQPSTRSTFNIYKKRDIFHDYSYLGKGLIQLNKPVIKPDEILKFRLFVVDPDLKPASFHGTTVSVEIKDPNYKRIFIFFNITLHNGIFENQIAIPTMPVMGTYEIQVMANGERLGKKQFEVRNYDMYSIDLNIYPTVVPLQNHQALNLTIDVKNSFGKPISGNLTIVSVRTYDGYNIKVETQTWDVNGIRQIYVQFKKNQGSPGTSTVTLNVTFTEQYTNRTINKEKWIQVYYSKYQVFSHNSKLNYHPGSPFTMAWTVTNHNHEPAKNVTLLVKVRDVNELYQQNCTSNMKGEIIFSMHTNETMDLSNLKVYDGDQQIDDWPIEKVDSADSIEYKFIEVELLTRVKFNRMIRLLVTCSHNMTILLYYVVTRGNIVEFGSFRPDQRNRYSFQLLVSDKLIPRSKIIVLTIVDKSSIHSYVDISINEFGNPLEIKIEENISEDGVDPGDEIELAIRGRPGAFVALAAYDQRLLQHGRNHDITFAHVWKLDYSLENGIFVVVTDDKILFPEYHEYAARGIYPNAPRFGMPNPYRTDFWESWLWQNLTIPSSGRFELVTTVPHSTTSWYITGISIDPKYGLGVVKQPVTFSTHKIFFILDHLPHSIKRNETVSLYFTLFSKIKEEFKATVTMFNVNNQIQFIDRPAGETNETKILSVPPSSDAPVSFVVKAMKLGELEIRVNASIMQGVISDSFKKIIIVLPEDVIIQRSKRIHFDSDTPSNQSFDLPLFIDKKAKGSIPVDLTVYPDQLSFIPFQNNSNVSLHHDGFIKSMLVNSEFKENITITTISGNVRKLTFNVTSSGSGVIQINWQYRLNLMHFKPRFDLQITKLATPTKWMKRLGICWRFITEKRNNHSNGTFVEVSIPIGYAMEDHSFLEETTINPIIRVETLHAGTTMLIYFNHIGNETKCFSVFAYRRYKMRVRNPSYIKIQDTFRPGLNAIKMFDFH